MIKHLRWVRSIFCISDIMISSSVFGVVAIFMFFLCEIICHKTVNIRRDTLDIKSQCGTFNYGSFIENDFTGVIYTSQWICKSLIGIGVVSGNVLRIVTNITLTAEYIQTNDCDVLLNGYQWILEWILIGNKKYFLKLYTCIYNFLWQCIQIPKLHTATSIACWPVSILLTL